MKRKKTQQKWKRARDTTIGVLATISSFALAGCIGVRDQLFQPLTAPPGGHPSVTFETDWSLEGEFSLPDPARTENQANRSEIRLPDTTLTVEPPDEADELLRELDELRPEPVPLDRGHDHDPRSLEWRA